MVDLDGPMFAGLPGGDFEKPPVQALVVSLKQQDGASYGLVAAGLNRYRPLDEGYRAVLQLGEHMQPIFGALIAIAGPQPEGVTGMPGRFFSLHTAQPWPPPVQEPRL
ncbi:hypothetical protein AB0M48_29670 [Lentzea sp. NPDC051208]|uniref:hypothetical protein n=1 Tax=Lentzea sp. NPDC051208 TaxID=3154642 RepID=UPI003413CFE9